NTWKTVHQCLEMLVNHVSRNGNLLMNVGPTSRGYLDYRALDRLAGYAEWMKYNSRSIYGCCAAPAEFTAPADCRYTYNPETKRLYLHIFSWPFKHLQLDNLAGRVKYAQFLHDGSEVLFRDGSDTNVNAVLNSTPRRNALIFELPVIQPHTELPVIEIILK
ncbi:MAG: alpha-L-fucosidase, partial [Victivallaceae bacterium]|nr:alpha-L-fucosidase [Victivallaceae bacterium]